MSDQFDAMSAATPVETNQEVQTVETPETEIVNEPVEADLQEDDNNEEEKQETEKKKADPKESQINRLKREKAELARENRALKAGASPELTARLEAVEKSLQGDKRGDKSDARGKSAPDPFDAEKYPLGRLDDRYIEDRIDWVAEQKAAEQADAVLQREQENEQNQSIQREQTALLEKVDELSAKGCELFEDFQDSVVETGMRGEWELSQTTFEAAYDADNGAQILYDLSQDLKEASRVAKLSPLAQLKFVMDRDAEIGKGKTPRTKPGAGEPPKNQVRGANSRTHISPATDNLDDFEKLIKNTKSSIY